ncbi:MAG: hypothetical protein H7Y60_09885 [Rhodospirillaceae bacterium]|nr:hypothetical protein [Rhodospirillales bacterium]
MLKMPAAAMLSLMALSACSSAPPAPPPACPKLPPVPAWIMEPEPSLVPILDRIITPSAKD